MPATTEAPYADRLVFLHGFTQTHHHWHRVALAIAAAAETPPTLSFVDLPGHGLSAADRSSITDAAARLPALTGSGTYIGYSMGGRVALLAAVGGDPAVERLVLIGATAGIEDDDERDQRAAADTERADQIETAGVAVFLDDWLAVPMFAGLPPDPDGLGHRRRNTPEGLAHSLRTGGAGSQPTVWHRLDRIGVPVLVIAGARDPKFTEIGNSMTRRIRNATFASVAGAGHAAHTERPELVASTIADWLVTTTRNDNQPSDRPIANSRP